MANSNPRNDPSRYHGISIALHWLMFLLLIAVYACIELRVVYAKGSDAREAMKQWHFMLGLAVLSLAWIRLLARFAYARPPIAPAPGIAHRLAASFVHALLYAFMIGMPLAGWLVLSAAGKPVPFFGLQLPALAGPDEALSHQVKEIHETVGNAGYYLVGLHAFAALFNHHFLRNDTLGRMLPWRTGKG